MTRLLSTFLLGLIALSISGCVTKTAQKEAEKRKLDKQKQPKSEQQLFDEARVHFAIGKYGKAAELTGQVIEKSPDDPRYQILLADIRFIRGDVPGAIEAYDEVIRLKPDFKARLWQRGLALYYAGEFEKGKEQFESHQTVNSTDVENAVWHLLCNAKFSDLETARKEMIPIEGDTRIPMTEIYEIFAGRMNPDQAVTTSADSTNIQTALYFAFLYNGLYYEMIGETDKSLDSIEKATKAMSSAAKDNLMNQLAAIHLKLRTENQTPNVDSKK